MPQPKKERSLHMLTLLMQSNRRYSVTDLAELLEVDRRTVYRYITTFSNAGFVIQTSGHHVRLAQNTLLHKQLSDLLYFNQEEAMTLYNAIDAIESDTQRKTELKEKLAAIYGTKTVRDKIIRLQKNKVLKLLMQAIDGRRSVILRNYLSPSSNTATDRTVEPFCLSEDSKHVWAYEISTTQNKLFKLSRIESVEVQPTVWLHSMHHRKGYTDAFRIISFDGSTLPVRLRLSRKAYSLMKEEYPLTEQDMQPDGDGFWRYEGRVSSYVGIGRFVMGLADCIEIETPELREYVRQFAQKFLTGDNTTDTLK